MPLREDLLEPIAGDNPSGANLYYDKVFDQIKEARTEDTDTAPAGAWERAQKKADHVLVIKLAGDALAKRSKDLRLAGWLVESHLKREGLSILAPGLDLLWKLQETFWETLYPEMEEDGTVDLRVSAVEGVVNRVAVLVRNAPITRTGLSALQFQESRRVGYEAAADTSEKRAARKDSIEQGQVTGEDFDASFNSTPKPFYAATEAALENGMTVLDELGRFQEEKYGADYPSMTRLTSAIEEVKQIVTSLLNEKRKTEPDPVEVESVPEPQAEPEIVAQAVPVPPVQAPAAIETAASAEAPVGRSPVPQKVAAPAAGFLGVSGSIDQAYAAVQGCAEYLRGEDGQSPVPYLISAGLRFGETRRQGASPAADFPVAPATETRQALRRLNNEGSWEELMKVCLRTLGEPCARAWLDLQRYTWRAAREMSAEAIAMAVASTVRGLLQDLPELRNWMLDDDTPVANAETQQWIDTEIFPPVPIVEEQPAAEPPISFAPPVSSTNGFHNEGHKAPEIYDQATDLLKRGKTGEAITMLVRDAELQPSGRKRFQRRVQVAQLCLLADQDPIAYPVLMELSKEIERRGLESWESGEMLAHPLSLLLRCLDKRKNSAEDKEELFERLCRLDPQAVLGVKR